MEVSLTQDQEAFIRQAIESGRLRREEEAVEQAMSLWEERERRRREDLSAAECLRPEFFMLAEQWRVDTQHHSQISKKVAHPAYFRIVGMGEPALPLILEALRDRPAHWFAALKAITGVDPSTAGASPSSSRDAWLKWGRDRDLVE